MTTRVLGLILAASAWSGLSHADVLQWEEARWRLELSGWQGLNTRATDRVNDQSLSFSVEREVPISDRWSVGLRAFPLFLYEDNGRNENIFGVAAGGQTRFYFEPGIRRGPYAEGGIYGLAHHEKFTNNSTHFNFMEEIGLGYQFERGLTLSLKFRHISNAGFGDRNSGINSVGFAVGYAF